MSERPSTAKKVVIAAGLVMIAGALVLFHLAIWTSDQQDLAGKLAMTGVMDGFAGAVITGFAAEGMK